MNRRYRADRAGLATLACLCSLVQGLVGCGRSDSRLPPSAPSAPSPVPQPGNLARVIVFSDPLTGLSTSDVLDAQNHIVQFTTGGELVWTADETRLSGHFVQGPGYQSAGGNVAAEPSCKCWLVVRFGTSSGQRRAYLTADYGHFNPGTIVELQITGVALTVTRTEVFPPGTYTLSGMVTEATETGLTPIENAAVYRLNQEGGGWDEATTDRSGFYEIHGLLDGSRLIGVSKDGYQKVEQADLPMHGDMRFDVQLVRR